MVKGRDDRGRFEDWEYRAEQEAGRRAKKDDLRPEIEQLWNRLPSSVAYTLALDAVQLQLQRLEHTEKRVQGARHRIGFRIGRNEDARATNLRRQHELRDALTTRLQQRRELLRRLNTFQAVLDAPAADGDPVGSERTRRYTGRLIEQTQTAIQETEKEIRECRDKRRGLGSTVASPRAPAAPPVPPASTAGYDTGEEREDGQQAHYGQRDEVARKDAGNKSLKENDQNPEKKDEELSAQKQNDEQIAEHMSAPSLRTTSRALRSTQQQAGASERSEATNHNVTDGQGSQAQNLRRDIRRFQEARGARPMGAAHASRLQHPAGTEDAARTGGGLQTAVGGAPDPGDPSGSDKSSSQDSSGRKRKRRDSDRRRKYPKNRKEDSDNDGHRPTGSQPKGQTVHSRPPPPGPSNPGSNIDLEREKIRHQWGGFIEIMLEWEDFETRPEDLLQLTDKALDIYDQYRCVVYPTLPDDITAEDVDMLYMKHSQILKYERMWQKWLLEQRARVGSGVDVAFRAQHMYERYTKQWKERGDFQPPPNKNLSDVTGVTDSRQSPPKGLPPDAEQKAREIGFGVGDSVPYGTWSFLETLGEGGNGHAGLWVGYDRDGYVVDRIVVKETYFAHSWNNAAVWWKGPDGEKVPGEIFYHHRASDLDSRGSCIVQYRGYRLYPDRKVHRIYCNFCEHGDMSTLIDMHISLRESHEACQMPREFRVPTVFIWKAFEALADAVCLLEYGSLSDTARNLPRGQNPVLHRDIKPLNIFLSVPHKEEWPLIPQVHLGDFGMAIYADTEMAQIRGMSTPGFLPPEQVPDGDERFDYAPKDQPVTPNGDVWTIGRCIKCLIELDRAPPSLQSTTKLQKPRISPQAAKHYDTTLTNLVLKCLEPDPQQRISVHDLRDAIRNEVEGSHENDHSLKFAGLQPGDLLRYQPDKYASWCRP